MQHEIPGAACQRVLDQRLRNAEPAPGVEPAPLGRHRRNAARDGLSESYGFEELQGRLMNALQIAVEERLVLTARHSRAHRSLRHRDRPRTERMTCFAATAAAGKFFDSTHGILLDSDPVSSVSRCRLNGISFW